MGRILLPFISIILLLPCFSLAAYKVYLKNGSVISGVSSYEKQDGEVVIHFGGGYIGVSEKDILRIEESAAPEKDFRSRETPEKQGGITAPPKEQAGDKADRINALKAELEALSSEIKTLEEEEAKLIATINEKKGRRYKYNIYQLRQLEKEIEPLQQELLTVQQKKGELIQQKAHKEGELRALE